VEHRVQRNFSSAYHRRYIDDISAGYIIGSRGQEGNFSNLACPSDIGRKSKSTQSSRIVLPNPPEWVVRDSLLPRAPFSGHPGTTPLESKTISGRHKRREADNGQSNYASFGRRKRKTLRPRRRYSRAL